MEINAYVAEQTWNMYVYLQYNYRYHKDNVCKNMANLLYTYDLSLYK